MILQLPYLLAIAQHSVHGPTPAHLMVDASQCHVVPLAETSVIHVVLRDQEQRDILHTA